MKRRMTMAAMAMYGLMYVTGAALACKIIINDTRLPEGAFNPVNITHKSFKVDVVVRDQVADVTVRPVFHNPNNYVVEGTYFLSIPPGAQVRDFKMKVGDKEVGAELLEADKARQIYTAIVQSQKDPALLELVGTKMLKASIFPIAANSDVQLTVTYTTLLEADGGLISLDVPFSNQFGGEYPVPQVSVQVTIDSKVGLKNLYSPTHQVEIRKKDDHRATISYEAQNYNVRKAFRVYWALNNDDVGLSLMTYRDGAGDGYFALLASPKVNLENKRIMSKDVVFVFDRSGSMAGDKMNQSKEALTYCINSLNDGDKFNIVDFASDANTFESAIVEATKENKARARKYIDELRAAGATNIEEGLKVGMAMMQPDPARISIILFATDGLPTVGEQRTDKLLGGVTAKESKVRIFSIGVGNDVNTQFLDRLAEESRGSREYVAPEEKIEGKVSALFEKLANPVLSGIAVELGGAQMKDVYPKSLPDLFKGNQLVVFGRYDGTGAVTLKVSGMAAGEKKEFRYDVSLPANDTRLDFLPRLWAARKVAFLVDSIRMNGTFATKEVVDEIVALGRKFGIVTPYTSFLITEENDDRARAEMKKEGEKLATTAQSSGVGGGKGMTPGAADAPQADSKTLREARKADNNESMDSEAENFLKDKGYMRRDGAYPVKSIGTKTFYLRGTIWTDGSYDVKNADKIQKIGFMSDEYIKLAAESKEAARYLGVGDEVLVVIGEKIFLIEKAKVATK